jgi:hypothetical protein
MPGRLGGRAGHRRSRDGHRDGRRDGSHGPLVDIGTTGSNRTRSFIGYTPWWEVGGPVGRSAQLQVRVKLNLNTEKTVTVTRTFPGLKLLDFRENIQVLAV